MKLVWRIVGTLSLVLLVLGLVAIAIGLFTGSSLDRMLEVLFGGKDTFIMMIELLREELLGIELLR